MLSRIIPRGKHRRRPTTQGREGGKGAKKAKKQKEQKYHTHARARVAIRTIRAKLHSPLGTRAEGRGESSRIESAGQVEQQRNTGGSAARLLAEALGRRLGDREERPAPVGFFLSFLRLSCCCCWLSKAHAKGFRRRQSERDECGSGQA